MVKIDCTTCYSSFPDLLFEPHLALPEARAHLLACAECRGEFVELQATISVLDTWTAPEPSQYFDSRVRAALRSAQTETPEGLWERLLDNLRFGAGFGWRFALAGAFLFLLLLGGGTAVTFWGGHHPVPAASSPTVNDLRIFDNNAQALQQLDLLDDAGSDATATQPQT